MTTPLERPVRPSAVDMRELEALIRNMVMRAKGGEKLLGRYDWLYAWRPPKFESPNKYVAELGEGETE